MKPKAVTGGTFSVPDPQATFDTFKQALKQVASVPMECVGQAMRDEQIERAEKRPQRSGK